MNKLSNQDRVRVISCLVEGNSIRATVRMTVIAIKLFSAMINPAPDPDALERQKKYFSVLQTFPKLKIILGKFQPRQVTCRSKCRGIYMVDEEKKTDVNMAVALMSDAIDGLAERVCIVSGDSDIQPAIQWVSERFPNLKIVVYVPALAQEQSDRRLDSYRHAGAIECKFLPLVDLARHQLKNNFPMPDGKFACRPESWKI